MNPIDFHAPETGKFLRTAQGEPAFVPSPLPPKLTYTPDLVLTLSRADAALSELAGVGRTLPNPQLLIEPYIRREAILSSRIEGTRTSLSDLMQDEVLGQTQGSGQITEREDADLQEVRNYVNALEYGIKRLQNLPLSLRLVRELHEMLMSGVRGEQATPGEFRRSQNWIGSAGSTLATAAYIPPPPTEMQEALRSWELFLHERDALPDLIQCALMHEQFEAIHPFLDGNGRIGRLLITLFLIERGRLDQPLLYLSDYIETNRQQYYETLQRVRTHGDWQSWLLFFLTGVAQTSRQAVVQAHQLMDLRESYRAQLHSQPKSLVLLDALFQNPYMTVGKAVQILQVSNPTARHAVEVIQKSGMLEEKARRSSGRIYVAKPILDILEK